MNLRAAPAEEIRDAIRDGALSAVELSESQLAAIALREEELGCYLYRRERDRILADAEKIDTLRASGKRLPPLAGLPFAVKDNIALRGMPTTCGSRILEGFHSPYSATAAERLSAAGAIVLGKTNMDEFGMGSSTENSAFQTTRNPWDISRVPGGSSGGSAAAVAAGEALFALGSDTGGSVRQPAAFCGVVGLKPTYGAISRYGLVSFASSFEQIGPMGRTVADVAMVYDAMAGHDPRDSTSVSTDRPRTGKFLSGNVEGLRIGVLREDYTEGLDGEVESSVRHSIDALRDRGAIISEHSFPRYRFAIPAYYIAANAEASANLARYDGVRYGMRSREGEGLAGMYWKTRSAGFGPEVKRRILLGTYALSSGYLDAFYGRAMKVRTMIRSDFQRIFRSCDLIAGPTAPTTAFKIGEKSTDPLSMYLSDVYTITANLTGLPAVSLPCGKDSGGLPIGLQLTGRPFEERLLLNAARALELSIEPIGSPGGGGE